MKRTLSLTIALTALSLTAACGTSTDDDPTTDGNNTSGGDDGALSRNGAPKPHDGISEAVSYTHLTLPTILRSCRSRWSPYH